MTRWNVVNAASDKLTMSLNSFPLLAVPFYILTGILMNTGGITERIFNFAKALLGHYTGGMGHVNIGASLLFSGMSGSALADAGGLGQLEIKAMRDAGYDDDICGGITAASCIIGPLVPPSIAMIIYGVIANEIHCKTLYCRLRTGGISHHRAHGNELLHLQKTRLPKNTKSDS